MIINNKTDFDNAPKSEQDKLKTRLAASIKQWQWIDGAWVLTDNTRDIEVYGLTINDFDVIPEPEMPDYNPDDKAREQANAERIAEIDAELARLDTEAIRPLRAINTGTDTQYDRDKLADLDLQAETLRTEREGLI